MNKPRKSSERKTPGSRGSSKSTGERGKHPFKKFMGPKGSPTSPKRSSRDRDDRKPDSERGPRKRSDERPKRTGDERPRGRTTERPRRSGDDRPKERKDYKQESGRAPSGRRFFKKDDERPDSRREGIKREDSKTDERKDFRKEREDNGPRKTYGATSKRDDAEKKPFRESTSRPDKKYGDAKRARPERSGKYSRGKEGATRPSAEKRFKRDEFVSGEGFERQTPNREPRAASPSKQKSNSDEGLIRLNKYLSNAGIASRRDADTLIISGAVKVNGVVVDQLGAKIRPGDKVTYGDQSVKGERKVYLLLNKPKDYITTMEDERDRKTVMKLVEGACRERIYPVGRLDRNTTGLLLMTNDGELTTKLTHPKHGIKKVYHVSLNKGLKPEHFKEVMDGIELEDGLVKVDDLAFVGEGKKEVGVEIHSGKNRVVRRLFEHLGYDVIKLDRVVFAGLTKKDLPRGKYRFLSAKEISFLQMIG
jgi:23S rRNA pseudouridine2605 synthase